MRQDQRDACSIFVPIWYWSLFSFLPEGGMCPFRHISGEKTVVCKHWLRGLCKKGDQCEFLHEYDMTKMPECYFYSKFGSYVSPVLLLPYTHTFSWVIIIIFLNVCILAGECSNKECPFLHIDPESKIKDCPWYDRGFCKHGKVFFQVIKSPRFLLSRFDNDFTFGSGFFLFLVSYVCASWSLEHFAPDVEYGGGWRFCVRAPSLVGGRDVVSVGKGGTDAVT